MIRFTGFAGEGPNVSRTSSSPLTMLPAAPLRPLPSAAATDTGGAIAVNAIQDEPVSILSSALSHLGISKGVQTGLLGAAATAVGGPGLGAVVTAASAASKAISPFSGIVPPGKSPMINQIFGLGGNSYTGGQVPRGYHISKKSGKVVRNRHMNFANGRAIRRATRRLKGAEKMFRKVLTVQHGAVHGHIRPKRGKHR